MSEESEPMSNDAGASESSTGILDDPRTVRRYLMWTAVALLAILAIVATFRIYTSVSTAIARFVTYEYRALFQAAFNLAVLLLAVAGIISLLRRLHPAQ